MYCSNNQLTSLNVQQLTNLEYLKCSFNQLTSLYVQGLTNLYHLDCHDNKLVSLDAQGLTNLIYLDCDQNEIINLNVNGLINLKYLQCGYNKLKSLDLQGLANLTKLDCYNNQLESLNLEGLTKLSSVDCYINKLTSLNLKGLTNLTKLNCFINELTSLNLNELTNLSELICGNSPLTSLDVKELTKLTNLACYSTQITDLDVKGLVNLTNLYCANNQLVSLDLEGLTNLLYLTCSYNQLAFLNIKGTNLNSQILFQENPNLKYICCNEDIIYVIKDKTISNGQNCEVNSYCSFTPGGNYYILKGENRNDGNNNGCDNQDIKVPNIKCNITNGSISGTFISNSKGNYSIPLQEGTYTITPILEHPSHFEVTPTSYNVTFPSTSDTITQDFCITPKGIFRQTNITVIPLTPPARPGFDASYKIVWENVGNQVESGTLNFTYDETLLDYISATQTADQVAEGIIKWNFTNLLPFEKREITVTLKVNRPTDTPAVNAGDKLYLTASILDNIFTLENTVVGSYDPNDKTCLQGDRVHPDMIGKYVDYLIRFENTGNYAAENLVVKDIIDTKTFDVSTLKITDASHEVYTRIEGNKVEFIFENINLPFDDANNDGYIAFKIKTLPTLVLGDSLKNLADIYFDYNFPIRTNEAQTSVAFPVSTKDIATEVNIYPNPVTEILYLDTNENWSKAEIYDISGRIMRSVSLDGLTIDVSGLESGTYFLRLKNGEKVGLVKFVKI
ncbi:MAG: leucine-rich repeat domain-containing protein [Saprospiraceae bacterium]|nr:leucine-rich repeat domain-containing protein [Saprospiraceae bacterium]